MENEIISASAIEPSAQRYIIVSCPFQRDRPCEPLKPDEVVVMSEGPGYENLFIRLSDMTIHKIQGDDTENDSYFTVTPSPTS